MRSILRLLLATFVAALVHSVPVNAQNASFGLVTQVLPHNQALRLVQAGAGSVRLSLDWNILEPSDNFYDPNYVNAVLSYIDTAAAHNLEVLLTIAYTPGWANGNQGINRPPFNYGKWLEMLQDVFATLGDRPYVTFGIWNEPDVDTFLMDDNYATTWKQLWFWANQARLNVGKPYIKLAGPDHSGYSGRLSYLNYAVPYMIANGQPHDIITVHYYPTHPNTLTSLISSLELGYPTRDIWMTEGGSNQGNDITQAQELESSILIPFINRSPSSRWKKIFIYQLTDASNFRLINSDFTNRVALRMFRLYANNLVNPVFYGTTHFQASNGQYVVAEDGGGGQINANRQTPGPWETFTLIDWNAGSLMHGDVISLWAFNYPNSPATVRAINGGGFGVDAASVAYDDEAYFIFRAAGPGPILPGDQVYLQTLSGHFFVAENGGGDVVNANRTAVGPWELFTITP